MSRSYNARKAMLKKRRGNTLLSGKRSRLSPKLKKKRDAFIKEAIGSLGL